MTKFDLSKRIIVLPDSNDLDDELKTAPIIRAKDIKEFIRELKDKWCDCENNAKGFDKCGFCESIDNLLGKKLVERRRI